MKNSTRLAENYGSSYINKHVAGPSTDVRPIQRRLPRQPEPTPVVVLIDLPRNLEGSRTRTLSVTPIRTPVSRIYITNYYAGVEVVWIIISGAKFWIFIPDADRSTNVTERGQFLARAGQMELLVEKLEQNDKTRSWRSCGAEFSRISVQVCD